MFKARTLHVASRIRDFMQAEAVLVVAAAAALFSCLAFPPTPNHLGAYAASIDFRTIGLLFCLMTVVAGLTRARLIAYARDKLTARAGTVRALGFALVTCVFFSSMVITNDVALISFVPLTLALLLRAPTRTTIIAVVAETVAANLGSMLTPIGNPQNIYLFSAFHLTPAEFFATMLPLGIVSYVCCIGLTELLPREPIDVGGDTAHEPVNRGLLVGYLLLLVLCLGCVAHLVSWQLCCIVIVACCLLLDRKVFRQVDYSLLFTFAFFFIFVGNLKRIDVVVEAISAVVNGNEVLVSALASQVISNVPAAIMLSGFTENGSGLLLGTNIGGLGTPVASLASLISLRMYARMPHARTASYLAVFTVVNVVLLVMLLIIALAFLA